MPSTKTIGRLSLYRRLLRDWDAAGHGHIFSHQLAALCGCTPAQVRRDVMAVGCTGSPSKGYETRELVDSIAAYLDAGTPEGVVVVGVGNLGRALLAYFRGWHGQFRIVAAFDSDDSKVDRVINGCRVYPVEHMREFVEQNDVREAIIATPAEAAQQTASLLYGAGVRGIVNFAPVRLWAPDGVYVENVDVTMVLERASFFARQGTRVKAES